VRSALIYALAFVVFTALPLSAQIYGAFGYTPVKRNASVSVKLWRASLVTMTAAHSADTVTSLQAERRPDIRESGWMYGAHFTGRDVAVKAGFVGVQGLVQWLLVRHWPKAARWIAALNGGQTVAVGVVAFRNSQK
jgi:hypothetical protein